MPQGPVTRIVIRRPSKKVEIIGRVGHHDPHRISRELSGMGTVIAVRHEMMPVKGKTQTVAIHGMEL